VLTATSIPQQTHRIRITGRRYAAPIQTHRSGASLP
jgi:hypothetical protein